MQIGIVGNGYVGKSTVETLPCEKYCKIIIYDINPDVCIPLGCKLNDIAKCNIIFVCVPTPMNKDGSCHTDIVKNVVSSLKNLGTENIIVRSTVPVGFCRINKCFFMPEFITEANWRNDIKNTYEWVFGTDNSGIIVEKLSYLLSKSVDEGKIAGSKIIQMKNDECELAKLVRNSFLATKVSFFNEINSLCKKYDLEYSSIRNLIILDKRIGESHTMVPGPDGVHGFGGTCFVKDISSLKTIFNSNNIKSPIIDSVIYRNNEIDRLNHDWEKLEGRAVV
jgi:UDPglucose 6-dehydrogenase